MSPITLDLFIEYIPNPFLRAPTNANTFSQKHETHVCRS